LPSICASWALRQTGWPLQHVFVRIDTAALLKSLGIDSAHIVGISLGGAVAFQLALDSPAS